MRVELEQVVCDSVAGYFERGGRLARGWSPGPPPQRDRILTSALGQDVEWLEQVARGQLSTTAAQVGTVRDRVLRDLYQPLASEGPALPAGFAQTVVGQLLATVEWRVGGAVAGSGAGAVGAPPITPVWRQPAGVAGRGATIRTPGVGVLEGAGLASDSPAPAPQSASAPVYPGDGGRAAETAAGWLPAAGPRFSWTDIGTYLLSERTLNGLLGLGALLILAAGVVISTLNPTELAPLPHFLAVLLTTAGFFAAGYVVRERLELVRTGSALLAIGAAFLPLDAWTLAQNGLLGWAPGTIWLLASLVCLPVYLGSHLLLRDRTFALLTAGAGGSLLLSTLNRLGVPLEWALCGLAALAAGYVLLSARVTERWSRLGWALFWAAQVATPALMTLGLIAGLSARLWELTFGRSLASGSDYAVGGIFWLATGLYVLSARLYGRQAYEYLAVWTLPLAYLFTLTKAPWSAEWYNVCLAALAVGLLAYGHVVRRRLAGGERPSVEAALAQPEYGVLVALSLLSALWGPATLPSQITTFAGLIGLYGAAAHRLRLRSAAYVSVALTPVLFDRALHWLALEDKIVPLTWVGLAAGLLAVAEVVARRSGESGRSLLDGERVVAPWRSFFAPPLFLASYAVSVFAAGLATVYWLEQSLAYGPERSSGTLSLTLASVGALYGLNAAVRRTSLWLYPAAIVLIPAPLLGALDTYTRLGWTLGPADAARVLALLGAGYVGAGLALDRLGGHYSKPPYLFGYLLSALTIPPAMSNRAAIVQVLGLSLLIYGASAWLVHRERHPAFRWLLAKLSDEAESGEQRVLRSGFVYLTAWLFPVWLLLALSLVFPATNAARAGVLLAGLAPVYVVIGRWLRRADPAFRWPLELGGYALSAIGPIVASGDPVLRVVALGVTAGLYVWLTLLSRRPVYLYPAIGSAIAAYLAVMTLVAPGIGFESLGLALVAPTWLLVGLAMVVADRERAPEGQEETEVTLADWPRRHGWAAPPLAGGVATMLLATATTLVFPRTGFLTAGLYVALLGGLGLRRGAAPARWSALAYTALAFQQGLRFGDVPLARWAILWAVAALGLTLAGIACERLASARARSWGRPARWVAAAAATLSLLFAVAIRIVESSAVGLPQLATTVGIVGLVVLAHGFDRRNRFLGYAGVGLIEVAYALHLANLRIEQPQAYVLPVGLYLLALAYLEWRRGTNRGVKALLEIAGATLLLGTTLLQALGLIGPAPERYVYDTVLLVEALALFGLGAALRWKRVFFVSAGFVVVDVGLLLVDPIRAANKWYLMAAVGITMIALVLLIERQRQRIPLWLDAWRNRLEAWD